MSEYGRKKILKSPFQGVGGPLNTYFKFQKDPYRKQSDREEAMAQIEQGRGKQIEERVKDRPDV